MNGLATRERGGRKVILPVWHAVDGDYVRGFSPTLADKLAISSNAGMDAVVGAILDAIGRQ